jgi:hypothetical protein
VAGFAALVLAAVSLMVPVVRAGRELPATAKAYADSGSFFHGLPRLSSSQEPRIDRRKKREGQGRRDLFGNFAEEEPARGRNARFSGNSRARQGTFEIGEFGTNEISDDTRRKIT